MELIGDVLKNIRVAKQMKRYELAMKSGITETQITNIEKNISVPGVITLFKLSQALEYDYSRLYDILQENLKRRK